MTRCKPLLGTFVEITIDQDEKQQAIHHAFIAIEKIHNLMGFHHPQSELSQINQRAHIEAVVIHPWTTQVIRIAKQVHQASGGLFDCGIGHRLVTAGLLPKHITHTNHDLGGLKDIQFIAPDLIQSLRPVCLDLGGIAKGFAVDIAVRILRSEGIYSGIVNAGGDLRVFGNHDQPIYIRNPSSPSELINIGLLNNAALATSSLYFAYRDKRLSHIINPLISIDEQMHVNASDSFSILANECVYADALTKVLALSQNEYHPCFKRFSAIAIRIPT